MKNIKVILVVCFVMLFVLSLCGCNNTNTGTATVADTSSSVEADASVLCTTNPEAYTPQGDGSEVYFYTEEDDLEIMTAPVNNSDSNADSEDKDEDTPATNEVAETQPEKNDKQEETRIELPFVPAN